MLFILVLILQSAAQSQDTTFIVVFGGQNEEEAVSVFELPNGNALTVSNTGSYGVGNSDVYFAEISQAAQLVSSWTWGGSEQDKALGSLLVDSSLLVTWGVRNTFNDEEYRYFVVAHTSNAIEQWLFDPGLPYMDNTLELVSTGAHILIVSSGDGKLNLKRLSKTGTQLFGTSIDLGMDFKIGACLFSNDSLYCALEIPDSSYSDLLLVKLDTNMTSLDSIRIDSSVIEIPKAIAADSFGGIYVLGDKIDTGGLKEDVFILKVDANLDKVWMSYYDQPEQDLIESGLFNSQHQICFLGYTESFGEGGDFIFGRYDSLGQFYSAPTLGSSAIDKGISFVESKYSGYWLFGNTLGFNSGLQDLLLYKTNEQGVTSSNAYLMLEDSLGQSVGVHDMEQAVALVIHPNPMTDKAIIRSAEEILSLQLFDRMGREVMQRVFPEETFHIEIDHRDVSGAGMYFIRLKTNSGSVLKKLIVY